MNYTYRWVPAPTWVTMQEAMWFVKQRSKQPTQWLSDGSKYVDIRFDSRTGNCLIAHEDNRNTGTGRRYIMIEEAKNVAKE